MVIRTAVINNESGLHLKPAARFCEEALKYESTVTFTFGNTTANANAAVMTPIHNGLMPKACCMALQMVLLWMEL